MKAVLVGRVVDALPKEFTSDDGKQIEFTMITVLDEEAFMDKDRILSFNASKNALGTITPESMVGKNFALKGNISKDSNRGNGELRFKIDQVEAIK